MLSILKNALVTEASKEDIEIRKRELDWFASNCWIIASQATVIAGFVFSQLSGPPPEDAGLCLSLINVLLTGSSLSAALCVLVRATLTGIYAQGNNIRV